MCGLKVEGRRWRVCREVGRRAGRAKREEIREWDCRAIRIGRRRVGGTEVRKGRGWMPVVMMGSGEVMGTVGLVK